MIKYQHVLRFPETNSVPHRSIWVRWFCSCEASSQIAKFTWPTWGQLGSCRPQVGPMLAPMNLFIRDLHSIPLLHPMNWLIIHSVRHSRVRATSTSKPSINHKLVLCVQVGNTTKINGRRTYVYGYTNILERNTQQQSFCTETWTFWPKKVQHTEAETKLKTFRRLHFQTYFLQWKFLNFD